MTMKTTGNITLIVYDARGRRIGAIAGLNGTQVNALTGTLKNVGLAFSTEQIVEVTP